MRAVVPDDGWVVVADAPPMESAGPTRRATPAGHGCGQVADAVWCRVHRLRAEGLALREIGAATAVSHETVRQELGESDLAMAAD